MLVKRRYRKLPGTRLGPTSPHRNRDAGAERGSRSIAIAGAFPVPIRNDVLKVDFRPPRTGSA
jgi:hypothetical protein